MAQLLRFRSSSGESVLHCARTANQTSILLCVATNAAVRRCFPRRGFECYQMEGDVGHNQPSPCSNAHQIASLEHGFPTLNHHVMCVPTRGFCLAMASGDLWIGS